MRLRHGGELRSFSEKFGIPEREVLDFSSNINPWGPPESLRKVYETGLGEIASYPDPEALEFRREVARHFPLWPENVIAGNGAIDLLDLILRFLKPRKALIVEPTFLEYRRLLNLQGTEVRSISLREREGFPFSLAELTNALPATDLAILTRPNNPTGTFLPKGELQTFLREAKRRQIFVVLDEAFIDWIPDESMGREVRDDSLCFVVRSLTKFYALPGIRIGYGLGSRKLIEKLLACQIPWSCNRLAQKLGTAALRDSKFACESRNWLEKEKKWFESRLSEIQGLKVYPSAANFLLLRTATPTGGRQTVEALGKQGFYLRDLSEVPALGPSYFRAAVKKRKENEQLIQALRRGAHVGAPSNYEKVADPL